MDHKMQGLNSSDGPVGLRASDGGILQSLPYHVVWTAKGYGWEAMNTSAIASLIVRPSTLSQLLSYYQHSSDTSQQQL